MNSDKHWTLTGAIKEWFRMWNLKRKIRRALKNTKFIKPLHYKPTVSTKPIEVYLHEALWYSPIWTHIYLDENGNYIIKKIPAEDVFRDCETSPQTDKPNSDAGDS